jgi:hypothetical protein
MNEKILATLNVLLSQDAHLLKNDVNERSITHKLAEYIQQVTPDWNVDCEYNKHGTDTKRLGMDARALLTAIKELLAKVLQESKITESNAELVMDNIDLHEKQVDIYGEKVPEKIAQSLYTQINKKMNSGELEEFNGMLEIIVTKANSLKGFIQSVNIYPDIIVHHRGTNDNLVVIEAKKSSDPKNERWLWDYVKLLALMHFGGLYMYKYGYFINLPTKKDFISHTNFTFKESIGGFTVVHSD